MLNRNVSISACELHRKKPTGTQIPRQLGVQKCNILEPILYMANATYKLIAKWLRVKLKLLRNKLCLCNLHYTFHSIE